MQLTECFKGEKKRADHMVRCGIQERMWWMKLRKKW